MADMERLQERLYEKLHRRPAGIDRMDRLWEAAVLLPIVRTEEGPAVLFEVRAKTLKRQPGEICFPGGKYADRRAGGDRPRQKYGSLP